VGCETLSLPLDDESLCVREFDGHILLLESREFAVELIGLSYFGDIESRRECLWLSSGLTRSTGLGLRLVELREEVEEGGLRGEVSWLSEERHVVGWCLMCENLLKNV
jgi:hypothetical protein